jgi:hypothetical protein
MVTVACLQVAVASVVLYSKVQLIEAFTSAYSANNTLF